MSVDIKHTYRGDLIVDLVAPDGTWRLKVQDTYRTDTGFIDAWSLQF